MTESENSGTHVEREIIEAVVEKNVEASPRRDRHRLATDLARAGAGATTSDPIGLARLAGSSLLKAMTALTKGSIDAAREIVEEVGSGEPITEIIDTRVEIVRHAAVHALGLEDSGQTSLLDGRIRRGPGSVDLKAQGNQMLERSWSLDSQPRSEHPSFAQILRELVPDEARILRFLAVAGPQPSIDIRTKTPFGVGSERLGGGINMIADMAGCAWPDRDHHYLANLNRLGLVRFSEEPVEDFRRYSLIEAQPKAESVKEKAKKAIAIYRSIYLSLFGQQFCEMCFDLEGYDAGGWASHDPGDHIVGRGGPKPKKKNH